MALCHGAPVFALVGVGLLVNFALFPIEQQTRGEGLFSWVEKRPLNVLVWALAGVGGTRILFWLALLIGNPAEAVVLYYLCSVMGCVFANAAVDSLWRRGLGISLGIFAILLVISHSGGVETAHWLALSGGLLWSLYLGSMWGETEYNGPSIWCAYLVSGLACLAAGLATGQASELSVDHVRLIGGAATLSGAGYLLSELGMRRAENHLYARAVLFLPILALGALWVFMPDAIGLELWIAGVLVVAGNVLTWPVEWNSG